MGHRGDDVSPPAGPNGRSGTDPASVTGGSGAGVPPVRLGLAPRQSHSNWGCAACGQVRRVGRPKPVATPGTTPIERSLYCKVDKGIPRPPGVSQPVFRLQWGGPELRTGCGSAVNQTPSPVVLWRSMDGAGVWCRRGCWVYAHPMPSAKGLFAGVSTVRTHPGTQAGCVVRLHANRLIPPRGGTQGFLSMPMLSRNLSWIAFRVLLG